MTPQNLYYSVVYHWDDIYCVYRDGNVDFVDYFDSNKIYLKNGGTICGVKRGCAYCREFAYRKYREVCIKCALRMREFVRCHPPEGVEILHWLPN